MKRFRPAAKQILLIPPLLLCAAHFALGQGANPTRPVTNGAPAARQNDTGWANITVKNGDFAARLPAGFMSYSFRGPSYKREGGAKFLEEYVAGKYRERATFIEGL